MFRYRWRFAAAGRTWRVELKVGMAESRVSVSDGDQERAALTYPNQGPEALDPKTVVVELAEGPLAVTVGYVSWVSAGCEARLGDAMVFRSHQRPLAAPPALRRALEHAAPVDPAERAAIAARAKARIPALYVDIAMAVVFFAVAKIWNLQVAAIAGAGAAVALLIIQRFVKNVDLLGGFALFGVAMSLLSAGAAVVFDSDLAVKLRGTVIGGIAALVFLIDAAFGGRVMGARLVGYMESLVRLTPQRAALAFGLAGLAIAAIDLVAAFSLSTDLWLVYNSFLDWAIAMPIIFGAFFLARERRAAPERPG